MRRTKHKILSVSILAFFLCLLLFETTFYQYRSGRETAGMQQTAQEMTGPRAGLRLVEQFQAKQTLNVRETIKGMERVSTAVLRIVSFVIAAILLASFLFEIKKREQEQSMCRFQTFFQSLLNILHRRDGKKGDFFWCNCG